MAGEQAKAVPSLRWLAGADPCRLSPVKLGLVDRQRDA